MNWFTPNLSTLALELQQLRTNQHSQQAQVIALLQEQNQLLKEILKK